MNADRRKFIRQDEEQRREALIAAALELIAEGGPTAATVRAIAERAGVTQGLIRHYFKGKDELTRAAYHRMMDQMTEANSAVLANAPAHPEARLAVFVAASLRPPIMDLTAMGSWAGFLHMMRQDPLMRETHEATYLQYRNVLQGLITDLPRQADLAQLRREAIACNAIIDGLWLEGSALPDAFETGELVQIGLDSIGKILGIDLLGQMSEVKENK